MLLSLPVTLTSFSCFCFLHEDEQFNQFSPSLFRVYIRTCPGISQTSAAEEWLLVLTPEDRRRAAAAVSGEHKHDTRSSFIRTQDWTRTGSLQSSLRLVSSSLLFVCFSLAKLTAAVMLSRDVPVHLFSTFVPTPYVVRKHERITSCREPQQAAGGAEASSAVQSLYH